MVSMDQEEGFYLLCRVLGELPISEDGDDPDERKAREAERRRIKAGAFDSIANHVVMDD